MKDEGGRMNWRSASVHPSSFELHPSAPPLTPALSPESRGEGGEECALLTVFTILPPAQAAHPGAQPPPPATPTGPPGPCPHRGAPGPETAPHPPPRGRLGWADAPGSPPAETRCSPLGRQAARLTVLREDLGQLQSLSAAPVED